MVKLKEIREKLDSYDSDQRESILGGLADALSPVSLQSLREFQQGWDGSKSFEEFVAAQNEVFRQCIDLECSSFGEVVRAQLGLDPINLDADIEVR